MARGSTATRSSTHDGEASLVGRGTRVRGKVQGRGDLAVEGQIEGDVAVTGDLAIAESGSLEGDVDANSVTIHGALTGDVAARGPVAIRATARVAGNMGGSEVSLEEGAAFKGRIEAEFDLPAELTGRSK